jgi:transposase
LFQNRPVVGYRPDPEGDPVPDELTDELWEAVRPLLPAHPPSPKGGRPRVADRECLAALLYLLRAGVAWRLLPPGAASPATVWRRHREWAAAGVWPAVHARLLEALGEAGEIDLADAVIDSASVRAVKGGRTPGRTRPTGERPAPSGT